MDPILLTVILFFSLVLLSVPLGISIGAAVIAGLWAGEVPFAFFTQRLFNSFDSFPLLAVPGFILAGSIMQHGTLANSLLALCRTTCGHMRGGLGHISVITCLFYGALCGSSIATVAAVGGIMIPAMKEEGYPLHFATAVNTSAGSLGVIIPPSIPLILYGSVAGCSVSDLFIAGIVPGILVGIAFMLVVYIISVRNGYGTVHECESWSNRLHAAKGAALALGVPVIVLGSIYGGITTPTEASAVAVVYAFIVETFVTKSMTWKKMRFILNSTVNTVGMILFVLVCANALGTLLIYYDLNIVLMETMRSFTSDPNVIIFICFVLLLFLGCFIEAGPIILILCPLMVPLVGSYGIDPVHFGLFMLIVLCIGYLTPPVGNNLFVGASLTGLEIMTVARACMPFVLAMMGVALLIGYCPFLSLMLI